MTATTRLRIAATVASLLATVPLWPVFETREWILDTWAVVAVVALTGAGLQALGVPRVLVPVGQLLVLLEGFLVVVAGDDMGYLVIPTPTALLSLVNATADGIADVARYAAPAPTAPGLVLVATGGIALMAWAVDALAVTARLVPWAGVPLLVAYAVPAGVLRGGLPWHLFVPVAAGFLLLLLAEGQVRVARWGRAVGPRPGVPAPAAGTLQNSALTRSGRRLGAVVIAFAVVVPAALPALPDSFFGGSGDGTGPGNGSGRTIRTDNPIVDLRRDLVRGDNIEILRYQPSGIGEGQYIRLVTDDRYDGQVWQTSDRSVPSDQQVSRGLPPPPGLSDRVPQQSVDMTVTISDALDSRWLPLTYPVTAVKIDGDWRYDRATLDVVANGDGTRGVSYTATFLTVSPTSEQLRQGGEIPRDLAPLTALNDATRSVLESPLAEALRGSDDTPYDKAVAIQDWLRGFTYSTDRRPGNSSDALADFLADRSGYCEQFAASMALMARAVGIPARVGVGFLPGTQDRSGQFVVRSHDAHAWPELYFSGVGWVRFEPTPATRTGPAPQWTTPSATTSAAPTTAASAAPSAGTSAGPTRPRDIGTVSGLGAQDVATPVPWGRIGTGLAVLAALAATPVAAFLARRRRWRGADGMPAAAAEASWADLRDAVRDARLGWDPARTPRTVATGLAREAHLPADERATLERLAAAVERGRYAPTGGPALREGPELRADAARLRSRLIGAAALRTRVVAWLLPVAGRDALGRLLLLGGSGLDELESSARRLRARVPGVGR